MLGGLEHDRAACRQRRSELPQAAMSGTFQGVMAPTTPTGLRVVKANTESSIGIVRPEPLSASEAYQW